MSGGYLWKIHALNALDFGCAKKIIHHDDTTITTFCSALHDASVMFKLRGARKRRDRRVVVVNKTSSEAASTNKNHYQSRLLSGLVVMKRQ